MLDRLILMANQIARNLEASGEAEAITTMTEHITLFWDPRMKHQIQAHMEKGGEGLSPIAQAAIKGVPTPSVQV